LPLARTRLAALLAAGSVVLAADGCTPKLPGENAPPPNVVLVTIDTLRADHCSVYGYAKRTTPGLERLAREGTLFEAAYAPMATTGPSHASMFTGLFPRTHGLVKNGFAFPAGPRTLTEELAAKGYRTAAVVSSYVLASKFGFARGFESYDDDFRGSHGTFQSRIWEGIEAPANFDRRADETTQHAIQWLDSRAAASGNHTAAPPFFLWVHYFDPHDPYDPPDPYRHDFAAAPGASDLDREVGGYDGEIAFTDAELGVFLDGLSRRAGDGATLVIVVGDHGEGLMDHGHMHHGLQIYEESVRVPWIVWWPGHVPAGRRVTTPVELVDLMPTVLTLVGGGATPPALQGRDLAPLLAAKPAPPEQRPVFLQRRLYKTQEVEGRQVQGEKYGVRMGTWKYLEALGEGTRELYDLSSDPGERRNRVDEQPERAASLTRELHGWLDATPAGRLEMPAVSPEDEERLRSLGYVP